MASRHWIAKLPDGSSETRRLLEISHAWRKAGIGALVLGLVVLTIGFIGSYVNTVSDRHALHEATVALTRSNTALRAVRAQQARQHVQLVQACERLNVQRAEVNLGSYADWLVDGTVLAFSRPRPGAPAQQVAFERVFLPRLQYAVQVKAWTPLTDCVNSIATSGSSFRAPYPVPIYRQRPPASAMDAINAQRPTPTGSRQ